MYAAAARGIVPGVTVSFEPATNSPFTRSGERQIVVVEPA
jgi:hypothetical protein